MLNLDALHLTYELLKNFGSRLRRIGKTTNSMYEVLGQMQVLENSTIVVLIHERNYETYSKNILEFLKKEGFESSETQLPIIYNTPQFLSTRRFVFKNNSNQLKIFTLNSIQLVHPQDLTTTINDWNNTLITDLDNMPPEFYNEHITIENCSEILDKYKKYIRL